MPGVAPQPKPVKGPAVQGHAAATRLAKRYHDSTILRLSVGAILADITWDANRTEAAEEAVCRLGELLGFVSTRPEKEFGAGPDNHWALTPNANAVIEVKTGVTRPDPELIKTEVNQLSGSVNWDIEHNPEAGQRLPVLIHPGARRHREALPPPETRVITPDDLETLKVSVQAFVTEIAMDHGWITT